MNRTSSYNLCQWEETDRVRRTDFNEDNAKIDQALRALREGKAEASALEGLALTVAGKGNCRVETFSYIGQSSEDRAGLSHTITFSRRPAFALIFGGSSIYLMSGRVGEGIFAGTYAAISGSKTIDSTYFTWEDNAAVINNAFRQVRMDDKGCTYQVIAWFPEDE